MVRTPCCDKSGMRKGTWTPEEDRKLVAYVTRYGCWNWRQLPKFAGLSRCGKSCRLRWMNYLRPDLKHGNYTKEEEELIIKLHESLGNRWSAIAAHLPGRTDNEIKNHWHTNLKNPSEKALKESKRKSKSHKRRRLKQQEEEELAGNLIKTHQEILESSEFSSKLVASSPSSISSSVSSSDIQLLSSSSFPPCTNADDTTVAAIGDSSANVFGEYDDFMAEIMGEEFSGGSFWTEPFLLDDYNTINYPPSPFSVSDALFCTFDTFDFEDVNPLMIW